MRKTFILFMSLTMASACVPHKGGNSSLQLPAAVGHFHTKIAAFPYRWLD
jgi:hypothetical protein